MRLEYVRRRGTVLFHISFIYMLLKQLFMIKLIFVDSFFEFALRNDQSQNSGQLSIETFERKIFFSVISIKNFWIEIS